MQRFYLIIAVFSGLYLIAQFIAYVFFGRKFFADTGVLFEQRKNRFKWQMVFPKDLLLTVVFLFSSSVFGLLLEAMDVAGWVSLPLSVFGGLAVNFLINMLIAPLLNKAVKRGRPTDGELAGLSGIAMQQIHPEGYGEIEVKNGGKAYYFDALTANGRIIRPGERIVVLHAENGLCFIESEAHLCDVLFDEELDMAELERDIENE